MIKLINRVSPAGYLAYENFRTIHMSDIKFLTNLGARIRELRLQKNMTQHELAKQCNFEKASMSRIESGKTNMTVLTLRKIGLVLETPMDDFFRIS
jgi:DNA-binding XRE family transcriptional regulator